MCADTKTHLHPSVGKHRQCMVIVRSTDQPELEDSPFWVSSTVQFGETERELEFLCLPTPETHVLSLKLICKFNFDNLNTHTCCLELSTSPLLKILGGEVYAYLLHI